MRKTIYHYCYSILLCTPAYTSFIEILKIVLHQTQVRAFSGRGFPNYVGGLSVQEKKEEA